MPLNLPPLEKHPPQTPGWPGWLIPLSVLSSLLPDRYLKILLSGVPKRYQYSLRRSAHLLPIAQTLIHNGGSGPLFFPFPFEPLAIPLPPPPPPRWSQQRFHPP